MRWMRSLINALRKHPSATNNPFRHALVHSAIKRIELGLTYLLWGCVLCMLGLIWQQGVRLLYRGEEVLLRRPPKSMKQAGPRFSPIKLVKQPHSHHPSALPSLFRIEKDKTAVEKPLTEDHTVTAPPAQASQQSLSPRLSMSLHIQQVPQLQAHLKTQLNQAKQQLQSGRLAMARQSFEQVLRQDPHQVIALAGMLVITSQRGEIQQRAEYLARLRQEIPDFIPEDDLFLMQLEED